jgi:hypothetical protein
MRRVAVSLVPLLLVLSGGCGPKGPVRQEISGTVLLDKQPLDTGYITFEPLDGQRTGDGSMITDGKYHLPRDKGLMPGRYRVFIVGGDGTSGSGNAEPSGPRPGVKPGRERIPPEYNEKSNVVREVTDGPNQFDFDIPKRPG